MFKHTKQLAYKVRVDEPNPVFAKMLQQAIGGVEGEIGFASSTCFRPGATAGPSATGTCC
jgi:Mn-containing catalase